LAADVHAFFMELEGAGGHTMTDLVKAPEQMKPVILSLIRREKNNALSGKPSGIVAKMNSLSDPEVIAALYGASRAGVPIRLIVRGVCCLLPGIRGLSETIQVRSIIGRHLEHARVSWFLNGGKRQVYLSSADWMSRNLDRRVESMFPIKDETCKQAVENVLCLQLRDNQKAWRAKRDGSYERISGAEGEDAVNAQEELLRRLQEVFEECAPQEHLLDL
ncbi:MAG: RNA degradosome polyphosphate kinase, partial [Clostridia bacterium]|nr:RNA degradosome polyphosphate kinase [Clostridia bacterium]